MRTAGSLVVRRLFGGLRDSGYVQSEKGHGGGWVLATPLTDITLLDVYRAVGEPPLFSDLVSEDHPECLVERAVNAHLSGALKEAEDALLARFESVTLAMLTSGFAAPALAKPKPKPKPRQK